MADEKQCSNFWSWLKENNSAVFMLFLILVFLFFTYHVAHAQDVDTETLRWARENVGHILVALVAYLQGVKTGKEQATGGPTTPATGQPANNP